LSRLRRGWLVALASVALACSACGSSRRPAADHDHAAAPSSGDPSASGSAGRGSVDVWAVGDGADGGSDARAVAARIARLGIDRLLYLGDVYAGPSTFARNYGSAYGRFARITSPTPGNHEWPTHRTGYDPYWRSILGTTPPRYYALRVAGWEILSLNSEIPHGSDSPQLRWLRSRLRAPGNCRIAFWHRPRYSAGVVHGDAPDLQPFWDALRGRAKVVIDGHDHDMQRFAPRAGITEFVSGAGGHGLYALEPHSGLSFGDGRHYGALRLRLSRGRARYAFIAAGGQQLDSGTLSCSGA
jgi:hypothetical protein